MAQRIPVERMEDIEQKHGVMINATAFLEYDEDEGEYYVNVVGEVTAPRLLYELDILISVYNVQGEIIGTEAAYIEEEHFEGIEPFNEMISIPDGELVGKVRIFPKRV
jgi:hypothetical protein